MYFRAAPTLRRITPITMPSILDFPGLNGNPFSGPTRTPVTVAHNDGARSAISGQISGFAFNTKLQENLTISDEITTIITSQSQLSNIPKLVLSGASGARASIEAIESPSFSTSALVPNATIGSLAGETAKLIVDNSSGQFGVAIPQLGASDH